MTHLYEKFQAIEIESGLPESFAGNHWAVHEQARIAQTFEVGPQNSVS